MTQLKWERNPHRRHARHEYRQASVPYFAGHGGLTSENGWNPPIGDPAGFVADLVTSENRIIGSLVVRF